MTQRSKFRQRLRRVLIVLAALGAIDLAAVTWFCRSVHHNLNSNAAVAQSDTAVVFFSSFGAREGLGVDTRAYLERAIELYRSNTIAHIICVGGHRKKQAQSGAELMRAYLLKRELPASAVHADQGSFDTVSNWRSAERILEEQNATSLVLVSSALHLNRIVNVIGSSPFTIRTAPTIPKLGSLERAVWYWISAHHEWIAYAANALLPQRWYHNAVFWLRNG